MELNDQIKEIMSEIEKKGNPKAVFGEPIKEGGITIIPVASISTMGGGGAGEGEPPKSGEAGKMKGKGFGMGYGKKARPVGYIKIENNQVKFVPITDWQKLVPTVAAVIGISLIFMMKMIMWKKMMKIYREYK